MRDPVQVINPDNFTDEVLSYAKPVLLLCMPRGDDFASQMKLMEDMALRRGGHLKVGWLADAFTEYFRNKLDIQGTPTFLMIVHGEEKNRWLGLTDDQGLEQFVMETLQTDTATSPLDPGE